MARLVIWDTIVPIMTSLQCLQKRNGSINVVHWKASTFSLCQWSLFMCVFWHYRTFKFDDVGNYFRLINATKHPISDVLKYFTCRCLSYTAKNLAITQSIYLSLSPGIEITRLYTDDIYKCIICDWFVLSSNLVIANGDLLTTPSCRCLRINVSCHSYICEVI